MNKVLYKLVLNFLYWGEAKFGTKAEQIVTAMTTAPMLTLVPDPLPAAVPPRADAVTALAKYKASALVAADGSRSAIKERDKDRVVLEGILKDWAPHLELTAKKAGDITILKKSGYDLQQPVVKPKYNGIPSAPAITVKRGEVSGSVLVRVRPILSGIDTYEGQYAVGDSTADANFKGNLISKKGSRITFSELEVAKLHQFRVRGIGSTGPGDWSDPASLIVT